MKLYGYWQSSATWRVRLALGLKGLAYEYEPVNLVKEEQTGAAHLARNPQGLVPVLETDDGAFLTQSLAIIHFLERAYPASPLLPVDLIAAAKADAIAEMIACEAQPFGNRRVLQFLKLTLGFDEPKIADWMNRWAGGTLRAVEAQLPEHGFFAGDKPGLPEIFIVPQLYAARRFGADIGGCKKLLALEAKCEAHPIFQAAHPFQQPDKPRD